MNAKNIESPEILSPSLVVRRAADQAATLRDVRIVLFTNSGMIGGMEAHLDTLTRGLIAHGVSVTVICPDYEVLLPMREALSAAGAEVYALPASSRSPVALLKRFLRLTGLLRGQASFVFHLHLTGSDGGTMPILAARLAGAKATLRTEHLPPDGDTSLRRRLLISVRDRLLDRVVCVSQTNLEQYVSLLGRKAAKLVTVHNSVDPRCFGPHNAGAKVRELVGATQDSIVIGSVTRMSELRKGVVHFIEMAKSLSKEAANLKFFIVGDGVHRAALEALADGHVVFLGEKPGRKRDTDDVDVPDCYAAMDVFVQPSLLEGGPITVLEAMASGLPVVSTDVGMVKEAIQDGVDGLIVPPGDTAALGRAVWTIVQDVDYGRRLGLNARKTIESRFGEDVMVAKMLALYADVIRESGR
jgi:glycosyltransferase involved in cell wall biosynthesis